MRFTDGLWMHRSGLSIHNTHQMWEYRIEQDRIKAFVLCHCVEEADDYTAGTALEYTFSCPAPDMIAVDVVHFRGTTVKEPAFTLHYAKAEPQITDTAESLVMENGRMRLVIRKSKQFAYDFYFDGRHLTGSENGSTAYIADADYEADKVDDVNHRTPKKPYMHTVYLRERLQLGIGHRLILCFQCQHLFGNGIDLFQLPVREAAKEFFSKGHCYTSSIKNRGGRPPNSGKTTYCLYDTPKLKTRQTRWVDFIRFLGELSVNLEKTTLSVIAVPCRLPCCGARRRDREGHSYTNVAPGRGTCSVSRVCSCSGRA